MGNDKIDWDEESSKHLGYLFRLISNQIKQNLTDANARDGVELTGVQCATMSFIKHAALEEVYQKDFEQAFSVTGATATNILKRLEAQDMVERIPNEKDGRKKRLILTPKGQEMEAKARDHVNAVEAAIIDGMTEEEITIFRDLLCRTLQNVEKMKGEN